MVQFTKQDCSVWLLLGTGHYLDSELRPFTLGLVLLCYNPLWTLLHIRLCFVIGQSFTLQPFLILTTSQTLSIL
jgi:hypothetical protein